MFRAAADSEKPRRAIDEDPQHWQRLRDSLHVLALEHGSTWIDLAQQTDVCPVMSGRDFELWHPLMGLASWIESHGAAGLLEMMQQHALAIIDQGRAEAIPDADDVLLRVLAGAVQQDQRPTPKEILDAAKQTEPDMFRNWNARTVSRKLASYNIPGTRKSGGRREFRDVTLGHLREIEARYAVDLELAPESGSSSPPASPSAAVVA